MSCEMSGDHDEVNEVMQALTRSQFETACKRARVQPIVIDEIGTCYVRVLTVAEWARLERMTAEARKDERRGDEFDARVCALLLSDCDGRRLYNDEDWKAILDFDHVVVETILEAGLLLNSPGAMAEEAEKN